MRLKIIESEFRRGGYDDHPYGEGTAREYYRDYFCGTIEVFDTDTSEWGDDVPDYVYDLALEKIIDHHGLDYDDPYAETMWWQTESSDGKSNRVFIEYHN